MIVLEIIALLNPLDWNYIKVIQIKVYISNISMKPRKLQVSRNQRNKPALVRLSIGKFFQD